MDLGEAAKILEHYIRMALEKSGVNMSADCHAELTSAVDTFRRAGSRLNEVDERTRGSIRYGRTT